MEKYMLRLVKNWTFSSLFARTSEILFPKGVMEIFINKEAEEEFLNGDPFVQEGLIANVTIKEWNDELM